MFELRFVSVHEDGQHLVVSSPDFEGEAFLLPLTDELRDAVATPPAAPARPAPTYGEQLTPREIQTRVRAGESVEQIALAIGLAGRPHRALRRAGAVRAGPRRPGGPGARPAGQVEDVSRTLAEIVDPRLVELGAPTRDRSAGTAGAATTASGPCVLDLRQRRRPAQRRVDVGPGAPPAALLRRGRTSADGAAAGRAAGAEPAEAPGLRVVPARTGACRRGARPPPAEAEAERQSIDAHPSGRKKAKARDRTSRKRASCRAGTTSCSACAGRTRRPEPVPAHPARPSGSPPPDHGPGAAGAGRLRRARQGQAGRPAGPAAPGQGDHRRHLRRALRPGRHPGALRCRRRHRRRGRRRAPGRPSRARWWSPAPGCPARSRSSRSAASSTPSCR